MTELYCPKGHEIPKELISGYDVDDDELRFCNGWEDYNSIATCLTCDRPYFEKDCLTEEQLKNLSEEFPCGCFVSPTHTHTCILHSNNIQNSTTSQIDDDIDVVTKTTENNKLLGHWINFSDQRPEIGENIESRWILDGNRGESPSVFGLFKYSYEKNGEVFGVIEMPERDNSEIRWLVKWRPPLPEMELFSDRPCFTPNELEKSKEEAYERGYKQGLSKIQGSSVSNTREFEKDKNAFETVRENRTDEFCHCENLIISKHNKKQECEHDFRYAFGMDSLKFCQKCKFMPNLEPEKSQSQIAIEKVIEAIIIVQSHLENQGYDSELVLIRLFAAALRDELKLKELK